MDTLIDKLAQKFNAQEIIKANTTAEAAQVGMLKEQVEKYEQCLNRLQSLLEEASQRPALIQSMDEEEKQKFKDDLTALLDNKLEQGNRDSSQLLDEKLGEFSKDVNEKNDQVQEEIHKECVKVYRNIQTVVEEKIDQTTAKTDEKLLKLSKKLTGIKVAAVFALLFSFATMAGVAFQILEYFKLLPF